MWLVHITGLEQMGYKGIKNGMHCYRRLPGKNVPLMESEKSKEGDPFPSATHEFSEAVDLAPAGNHQDGTKLLAMNSSSEEGTQEKEEISFSQDLALLFVVEEQIWGRLSNSVQKEASVELERSQRDAEPRSEPSEGERNRCVQEAHDISSQKHPGQHAAVPSLGTPQSSFASAVTQAQGSSAPSEVPVGKVGAQAFADGFRQALNSHDTCPEVQGEETTETESVAAQKIPDYECLPASHDISKCHQSAESLEAQSSVNHSWERDTRQEMGQGILERVQTVQDTEMHPCTVGVGQIESGASTKNEEQEERDLKEEKGDLDLSAPCQSSVGSSEDRRIHADRTQTEPGGILSLISPQNTEDHLDMEERWEEPVENSNSAILHFLANEEDDEGEIGAHSLKEKIKTKGTESYIDYGKLETDQKDLLQKGDPESTEIEALELGDSGWNGRKEILDWRGMENKMGGNDNPELEQDVQGGQGRDMKEMKAAREEVQRKMATLPVTPGLDTLSNQANNVASPDLNQDSSLTKIEGFDVSLELVCPSSHCPKSTSPLPEFCVQAAATPFARTPTEGLSPKTQPPVCFDPTLLLEDSGMYDQADYTSPSGHRGEQPIEEDRKGFIEKEVSESAEDGENVTDGEGMLVSCGDLILPSNPEDLQDLQPKDYPIDDGIHILPISLGIKNAASALQLNPNKGSSDCIIGNSGLCENLDLLQDTLSQDLSVSCHLDLVDHDEASAVGGNMVVQDSSQKGTSIDDFHEDAHDSSSKSLQNISPGEGLHITAQQTIELSHVSSCTTRDPVSLQEKDTTICSHQHQQPPMESFLFPGKDTGADALYMEQQMLNNESSGLSDCGQNGIEGDHNTDSPTSLDIPFSKVSDETQLTRPLTSVLVSGQTSAPEHTSIHFDQLSLFASGLSHPVQSIAHPHKANATPHAALVLHPRHLSQHERQVSSSSETSQSLAPIESPQSPTPSPDAGHFEQPTASECDLNQYKKLPDSLLSQPVHLVQLGKSSQSRECIASESNTRLPTEDPNLAGPLILDIDNLTLTSSSSNLLNVGENQFVEHSAGAPVSNLRINCTEGDDWAHGSVPIASLVSQRAPSVDESKGLSKFHKMESSVEEFSVAKLAKSEGTGAHQDQKDLNTPETSRNLGLDLLGTQSDSATLGNDTFAADNFPSISKTMSMDTPDGKVSFDLLSHHLVESQKRCEAPESRNSKQTPLLLAFTNPIHFLQCGPPSPPTRHPQRPQPDSQEPQWWQANAEIDAEDMTVPIVSQPVVGDTGSFKRDLGKPVKEQSPPVVPRKDRTAKHLPLEKSSSCPYKNVADTKGASNSKKQEEERIKYRTKSKDWHRQGVRKTSIPTDSVLEGIAPLVPSKEEASAQKQKAEHFDRIKYGERKAAAATVEHFKRRHSKLINSSRLLYQEYSDVALNKAIQNQKRDSLSEDVEPGSSPDSPRLRRKVLISQDSYLQRLSVSSSASLWQDIPMVRGSTMLLSMTREEQKLQEAKFELIASEASYLRSLNIAVDHFQHSQELQAVLSNQDRQWLFSRLQDVRDVSANFLFDLEEKLEENMFTFNVCDVALRHAPEFRRVYLPYVTNQTYQEQTFQRLMNGVPAFQQVLEKLESDPVCQRLSLKSFLILPFQRITRLKLLLQNILKRTRPGAAEEIQATQAYDALEKLIKDCNNNVQRMKSTEELIHLSKNMEFECKIFPLISQSRRLVKHGELTALEYNPGLKWKLTTRSIYLHLFNDYLLLSRPRENGRFIVFDYAASSDVRGEKCEMKLHGTNKNVFRLFLLRNHQGKKVEFLFRTETQSEKLRWISALTSQQIEPDFLDDPDALQVQGVKSYKPRENDELALEKADIIMVLKQSSDGWLEGVRLSDGERGWFPLDHVDFISSKQVRQMNLKEEQRVKHAKQQVFHRK